MILKRALKENTKAMCELFNRVVIKDGFFKPINEQDYDNYLTMIPGFKFENVVLAFDNETLVGFGIAEITTRAFINCLIVDQTYRNQGIGQAILNELEQIVKCSGINEISIYGHLPSCYAWYIPNTDHHDHPCCPGVSVNSPLYLYLIHRGYEPVGFQDAFHLNLSDYEISDSINAILEKNKEEGITIEMYDPKIHTGLDEFYQELNLYDFEKVIKDNLNLDNPYPFLVVSKHGKIVGWTGALWNEESGRGHFDGIAILQSVRGKGLGKALFSLLAYHSKLNGAKFMTFYTNLNNHARYIYMGAGFKIVQSFALMKKKLK